MASGGSKADELAELVIGSYGTQQEHKEMMQRSGAIFGDPDFLCHATGQKRGKPPKLDIRDRLQ